MHAILSIAKYTIIEQIRNRLYLIIILFGVGILGASFLLGALAPGYKARVIFDLGLVTLEVFGLATAIFGAVTLVLQEIESKTIYLLVTRPVPRHLYILGRFFGLVLAVAIAMVVMSLFHLLILHIDYYWFKKFTDGWAFWPVYGTLFCMTLLKMMLTSSVALFFSLFATSSVSALIFTGFFWVVGHFGGEIQFLIDKTMLGGAKLLTKITSWIFPNYQFLNFRDTYAIPSFPGFEFVGWSILYAIGYTGVALVLSSLLFNRKEF